MNTKRSLPIQTMLLTAMCMALIMVLTFATKIPVPATQGYIHLGDCMIFLSVLILGRRYGTFAAAMGSALADLVGGYAFYAPITFVVKGLMAFLMATFLARALDKSRLRRLHSMVLAGIGMFFGGLLMVAGYYVAESLMYGSFVTPLAAIPMNCVQFIAGMIIAVTLAGALSKTPVGRSFAYPLRRQEDAVVASVGPGEKEA